MPKPEHIPRLSEEFKVEEIISFVLTDIHPNLKKAIQRFGIKQTTIPCTIDTITPKIICETIDLILANDKVKLWHCRRGADKTGIGIAALRARQEKTDLAELVKEMRGYFHVPFLNSRLTREVLPKFT